MNILGYILISPLVWLLVATLQLYYLGKPIATLTRKDYNGAHAIAFVVTLAFWGLLLIVGVI